MADVEDKQDSRFDDVDLEKILARVERRGPLTFTRKRCLYRAPEFVKKLPKEETVEEGSTVTFECKAVGFPKPTVNWTKDIEIIPDNPRITFQYGELGEATIEIQKVKKCDEGSYRCKAENTEGTATSSVYISVKAKPKSPKRSQERVTFTSRYPTITEKIDEEEKEAEEIRKQPVSPLTYLYDGVTIKTQSWPEFLGNWAFLAATDVESLHDSLDYIDDEDVFLPDSSVTSSEKESDCGAFFNDEAPIPNLVFENKKLVNAKIGSSTKHCTEQYKNVVKDENANHRVSLNIASSNSETSSGSASKGNNCVKNYNLNKDNSKDVTASEALGASAESLRTVNTLHFESSETGQIRNELTADIQVPNGVRKVNSNISENETREANKNKIDEKCAQRQHEIESLKKFSQKSSSDTNNVSQTSSQKRPLTSIVTTPCRRRPLTASATITACHDKTSVCSTEIPRLQTFVLLISGVTFLALNADVTALNLVFYILLAQFIHLVVRYMCGFS